VATLEADVYDTGMADKPANSWGASLKRLRLRKGLTQPQAAEFLSVPLRTYQNWEQGRSLPPGYVQTLIVRTLKTHGA
jgi:DNA-binding transcriptional regulator YiaG